MNAKIASTTPIGGSLHPVVQRNPPFGQPNPAAKGEICNYITCHTNATHHHPFYGWLCRRHWGIYKKLHRNMR